ncbi:hypothetical protein C2S52_013098 [Perilla frutescens var. hirtella]|nr:hypothetical protein C2S52_013098 [Perilla frutescens var. hirtella]
MTTNKEWMSLYNDRLNEKYQTGVENFLNFAFGMANSNQNVLCPCVKCKNTEYKSREEVKAHLDLYGIMPNYTTWLYHGEKLNGSSLDDEKMEKSDEDINEILMDLYPGFNGMDGCDRSELENNSSCQSKHREEPNKEAKAFYRLLKESEQPSYPGCESSKLSILVHLLHIKSIGRWSNESFDMLLQLLKSIQTKFNMVGRNYDGTCDKSQGQMSIFSQYGRTLGAGLTRFLSDDEWEKAHIYILKNCDEIQPFIEEYSENYPNNVTQMWDDEWNNNFIPWFKNKVEKIQMQNPCNESYDLLSLSRGPTKYVKSFNGYAVNGFRFRIEDRDRRSRTQNSGVCVVGDPRDLYEIPQPEDDESNDMFDSSEAYQHDESFSFQCSGSTSVNKDDRNFWRKTNSESILVDIPTTKRGRKRKAMSFMIEKSSKGNKQRPAKFIAPGHLARARIYGQKTPGIVGDSKAHWNATETSLLFEDQEHLYMENRRVGGISTHTLTLHFGEEKLQDSDFTEDSCYLDILKMCSKFIDVESVGFDVTNGDGRKLKNDKDVLALLEEHEFVENIDIYLDINEAVKPLHFKLPQDNTTFGFISKVPEVRKVSILGEYKSNERVTVKGDVMNGTEEASTVEFFITKDKHLSINSDLPAISECMTSKDFQVPKEAEGHYLVAKYTPKSDKGKSGKPRYVMTDNHVQDSTTQKERKVRGKNKNTKIAMLNSGEKLEIEFYNNRAVGKNHTSWSRHLGKIKISIRNSNNRGNGVMPHRTGSQPHRQLKYEMGGKHGQPPDVSSIFKVTRQKKGEFVQPEAEKKYDEIVEIVKSNPSLLPIEVVERSLGPQKHSNVFTFGGGMKRKHFKDSSAAYIEELEVKLREKEVENMEFKRYLESFESRFAEIEKDKQPRTESPPNI